MPTYGEIRRALAESGARWQADARPQDDEQVRVHPLGVPSADQLTLASEAAPIDLPAILRESPTANPFLNGRRAALGIPAGTGTEKLIEAAGTTAGFANVVDWRNRFGGSWVTGVRDQDPCESCVAFGTTAVIESRVRIEHAVWTIRSEGDAHDALGMHCADGSWPNTYLDWIKTNGICDPGCWPYQTDNPVYKPTPDRSGRTVKIDGYSQIRSAADQKTWIDTVGPITACIEVWTDFDAYRTVSVTMQSAPLPPGAAPGTSTDDLAVIEALSPGSAILTLTQRRSWESRPPRSVQTFQITISA